jgi:hypothetical protein
LTNTLPFVIMHWKMDQIIIYILAGAVVILAGWVLWLTSALGIPKARAEVLFSDKTPGNLAQVIESYMKSVKEVEEHGYLLDKELKKVRALAEASYQRIGFVRYNPFGDVGGNLSFSVCILDDHENGFVISSIHSREGTRVYGKTVHAGSSEYNLSEEEKKAILLAQKGKGEQNV